MISFKINQPPFTPDLLQDLMTGLCDDVANNTVCLSILSSMGNAAETNSEHFNLVQVFNQPLLNQQLIQGSANSVQGSEAVRCELMLQNRADILAFSQMSTTSARALGRWIAEHKEFGSDLEWVGREEVIAALIAGTQDSLNERAAQYLAATDRVKLLLYKLKSAPNRGRSLCTWRCAQLSDLDLVTQWSQAFLDESGAVPSQTPAAELARKRITSGDLFFALNPANEPIAMAGASLLPGASARIGPVYTLPTARGQGVAQALVADTVQHIKQRGAQVVFLFTDAQFPASNICYQRVGFELLGGHRHVRFQAN